MATIIRFIIRIYFLSLHAFISRQDLPRVALRPYLFSVYFLHLRRVCPPHISPVSTRRRAGPIVSNRRFKFWNIFRLPASLCPFDVSSHDPFFFRSLFLSVVFLRIFLSALLSWLSRGRLPFSFLLRQNGLKGRVQGKVKGGGNDFEIFVAVHKFEGGGRAYLNTDRAFSASDSSS